MLTALALLLAVEPSSAQAPVGGLAPAATDKAAVQAAAAALADVNTTLAAAEKGDAQAQAQLAAKVAAIKGNPNLSERDQFLVLSRAGGVEIAQTRGLSREARLTRYAQAANDMIAQFPAQPEPYQALLAVAEDDPDEAAGAAMARTLAAMTQAPPGLRAWAQARVDRDALLQHPFSFSFYDADGKNHLLAEYRGKVVVLCAWASANPASMAALAQLAPLASDHVVVLGVNLDSSMAQARATALKSWPTLPQAYDPAIERGALAKQLKLTRLPMAYVVDANGILQDVRGLENTAQKLSALAGQGGPQ